MHKFPLTVFVFVMICVSTCVAVNGTSPRTVKILAEGWSFMRSDIKEGAALQTDESGWQKVQVPHDWAIAGPFNMNIDVQEVQVIEDGEKVVRKRTGRTGALPFTGVGWYRIYLDMPAGESARNHFIEFDGAMSNAEVFLNGKEIGVWPYGYSSFSFDLTPYLHFGGNNLLAVKLENLPQSSRWYPGAGLYRQVRLVSVSKEYIPQWGTYITTPKIAEKEAIIEINTSIIKHNEEALTLVTEIYDPEGKLAARCKSPIDTSGDIRQKAVVKKPNLWSIESPYIYKVYSLLYKKDELVDCFVSTFGIRSLTFDPDQGFFLNGKRVQLKGVCLHHDLGAIGIAFNVCAARRQLEMLKEMGCNAIRTSHNPPAPQWLELCDTLGMLVVDEIFDEWREAKNANGYSRFFDQWSRRDLEAMIRRDRNHPSIMMWSIGNEIREQSVPDGGKVAAYLAGICRELDPTRPVTAGMNNPASAVKNGVAQVLDVLGLNYKPGEYRKYHEMFPDKPIYGSETASTVSSRGIYKFPVVESANPMWNDYQVSSYDMERPRWGTTPDTEFEAQEENPFVMGEFVWTGFDYLGEPTPYNETTPARSSYFGIIDLAGLPKDRYYLYQSHWSDRPVLHLLPHWNWEERLGQRVPVYCYTNYPKAELFVNDKSMGIRETDLLQKYARYRLIWENVTYTPGNIRVVAYDHAGAPAEEKMIRTAGNPYKITLVPDRLTLPKGGEELCFITIEVADCDGNPCPRAAQMLKVEVSGAGRLKGLCNGDATDQTSFHSNYMRLFSGKMVAVVECGAAGGEIVVTAYGGALKKGKTVIMVE